MKIIIYYRICEVKNLIMKNNITRKNDKLATSHVVYEVQCTREDCSLPNASYIAQTENEILTTDEPTPTERSYFGTHVYSSRHCDSIIR